MSVMDIIGCELRAQVTLIGSLLVIEIKGIEKYYFRVNNVRIEYIIGII